MVTVRLMEVILFTSSYYSVVKSRFTVEKDIFLKKIVQYCSLVAKKDVAQGEVMSSCST